MRGTISILFLTAAVAAPAHDLWLQPRAFWLNGAGSLPLSILVGHGQNRENWGIRSDRILILKTLGPDGKFVDRKSVVRPNSAPSAAAIPFTRPGTHLLLMQSNDASSELPAGRFDDYLKEEGLTPAILHRQRARTTGRAGRELYSRRAKTIVQVGAVAPQTQAAATKQVGFTLEIVPERNPYGLPASAPLPVRVFYEGKPLAGALVKLTNLDADEKPVATQRTNAAGRAAFSFPRRGNWLINVVWTKPISGNPKAEFQTVFSSLSFGYPGARR